MRPGDLIKVCSNSSAFASYVFRTPPIECELRDALDVYHRGDPRDGIAMILSVMENPPCDCQQQDCRVRGDVDLLFIVMNDLIGYTWSNRFVTANQSP